ncbi:methyltransferase domain-containing protein [Stackebrandtia nassauensis]|uniref:Methyltransferase type 11 n=1 Tax=Stackebrandtia nassauensis (strain DSM 44728 / CIP 108903 / NRRL B-16338 / NBRC 102104 / LLR-40K-21) TaxID=446470 RepID=D3Q199_STANL|nr:methyltransferase domain-containing protein [Stackebrandtia nassauensis]ADD45679.1 Methyltransferase type 11 [Stackebrandtia nassauensis DSM 44728]
MSPNRRSTVGAGAPESFCRLIASTTHGLEELAAEELTRRGHRVVSVRKRQILLASPWLLASDRPRLVDDLLIQVTETADPGPTKAELERLRSWLTTAELTPVDFGDGELVFSVSASMAGRRAYNRYDLEAVVGSVLAQRFDARFASRAGGVRPPADAVEWRAVLSAEGFLLGLRGRRAPLHRRVWKTASIPGTLHPPVAAAMAQLADLASRTDQLADTASGLTVLDPCCGAGTILVEARELAPRATLIGSDLDAAALAASASNTRHLPDITFDKADAAELPLPTGSVDRIVTNPAWGRQVTARHPFPVLLAEWRRVLAPDGRLVCLVPPELLRHFGNWDVRQTRQLSLSGRHPVIVVAAP